MKGERFRLYQAETCVEKDRRGRHAFFIAPATTAPARLFDNRSIPSAGHPGMLLWRAQAGHCLAGAGLRRPRARGTQASARAECKTARPLRLGDRSVTHGCAGITGSQALFAVAGVGPSPRTTHMLDEIPQQVIYLLLFPRTWLINYVLVNQDPRSLMAICF